jgi:hypothetical protein
MLRTTRQTKSALALCLFAFTVSAPIGYGPTNLFADESIIRQLLSAENGTQIEAFVPCSLEGYSDARCVVTVKAVAKDDVKFHDRALSIYEIKPIGFKKIFLYGQEQYSGLVSIGNVDMSSVMAIWQTGSATVVTVFRVIGDEIRLVLEVGAKFLPR